MPKNVFAGTGMVIPKEYNKNASFEAGVKVAEQSIEDMKKRGGKNDPSFGVVYCSTSFDVQSLIKGIQSVFGKYKNMKWVGCTTAGEISNYGVTNRSVVAMVLQSDYIHVEVGVGDNVSKNPEKAGETAVKMALSKLEIDKYTDSYIKYLATKVRSPQELIKIYPYSIITLLPGSTKNYPGFESAVLRGIQSVVGSHIPIIGGSAGDDFDFKQTYQFVNGKVYTDAIILCVQAHDVFTNVGVSHGFKPTNKNVVVTESQGKVINTLNKMPAIEVYSSLVNWPVDKLKDVGSAWAGIEYPLGIKDVQNMFWIKSPQAGIENSLMFFADIPINTVLTLMKVDPKLSLDAAKNVFNEAKTPIAASLIFDCGGRKSYLKEKVVNEVENMKKSMKDAPFIGFYSYSEVGFSHFMASNVNNATIVAFNISDKLIIE